MVPISSESELSGTTSGLSIIFAVQRSSSIGIMHLEYRVDRQDQTGSFSDDGEV